ncbi:MAG: SpoIID/LytB domain-containing protein [Ruminococcus sp.]
MAQYARTYAGCQILRENSLKKYGADVDDSVNYQVYNNFGADKRTNKAVQDTKGQILCQNGEPISLVFSYISRQFAYRWNLEAGAGQQLIKSQNVV